MAPYLRALLGALLALAVAVPAAFTAGAAVFADGPPILSLERIVPVIVWFLVTGLVAGFGGKLVFSAAGWWAWGSVTAVPALFTIFLFGREIGFGFQLFFLVLAWGFACLGALPGTRLAERLKARNK